MKNIKITMKKKRIKISGLTKRELENSFNEVRLLASLNHKNVIGYREAFYDQCSNTLNIVMEFADDGDLSTKNKNKEIEILKNNMIGNNKEEQGVVIDYLKNKMREEKIKYENYLYHALNENKKLLKKQQKIENEILTQIPDAVILTQFDLERIPKYHIEKIIWSNYAGAFKYDKKKRNKKIPGAKDIDDGEGNKFTYNGLLMNKNRVDINNIQTEEENDEKEKKTTKTAKTNNAGPPKRLGYVYNDERQKENDEGHLGNRNNIFKEALKDLNYNTLKIKNTKKFFQEEENKTAFINAIYPISKEPLNEKIY